MSDAQQRFEEAMKRARADADPVKFIKEEGFARELELLKEGRCPVCRKLVAGGEKEMSAKALREFQKTGICPSCFEKWQEGKL